MSHKVAELHAVDSSNLIQLNKRRNGKLSLDILEQNKYVTKSHVFSEEAFNDFFGSFLNQKNAKLDIIPSESRYRTELTRDLIHNLDEKDIKYITNSIDGLEFDPNEPENRSLEVLKTMESLPDRFTSREFSNLSYLDDSTSRSWIKKLKNQGYISVQEADRDDGRIKHEYELTNKARNYILHMSE